MKNSNRFFEYKDMYNIYNLITKIDNNYKLVFDGCEKMFCIINTAKNNQICYKTNNITPKVIEILKISRIENIQKLVNDIENNNSAIELKNKQIFKQNLTDKMLECLNFSKRSSSISSNDINKILGEKKC